VEPTQLYIKWEPWAISPGIKRPGREDDHSPLTIAENRKRGVYTSTTPYMFMSQWLLS
jgi:hypothetical protein